MTAAGLVPIRRALLGAADQRGLLELATALDARGVALVATHLDWINLGTQGLMTTALAEIVPPRLDRRLDTLVPEVHAAIAARDERERAELAAAGIEPFELVVANPIDFAVAADRCDGTLALASADVDAGGVALIRAAAQNWAGVAVVVDPDDYPAIIAELDAHDGALTAPTRLWLASKAFAATAAHDAMVASYLADVPAEAALDHDALVSRPRLRTLVTGPGRRAPLAVADGALYAGVAAALGIVVDDHATMVGAQVLGGGALPAAVVRDLDRAFALACELGPAAAAIVRGDDPIAACAIAHPAVTLRHVLTCAESVEALAGAALALAYPLTAALVDRVAGALTASGLAAIIVPEVAADVAAAWPGHGPRLVVASGRWHTDPAASLGLAPLAWRSVTGGVLVQEVDVATIDLRFIGAVTTRVADADQRRALELAARVVRHVRAHALVIASTMGTVAIVGGQPDLRRALAAVRGQHDDRPDCVAAVSARIDDPLDVEALAQAGLVAVAEPGGSPRDLDVIAAADRHHLALYLTGVAHLRS